MTGLLVASGLVATVFAAITGRSHLKNKKRASLLANNLSADERAALAKDFHLYGLLPDHLRDELDGLVHVFIEEKSFEPCGELEEVTLHMKQVIAAQACLLLLNRKHDFYPRLRTILLYPNAYKATNHQGGTDVRLGESWGTGSVVLSWKSVLAGGQNSNDGHDVVLHEFAHQLDQADGEADGAPELEQGGYRDWARVFHSAYSKFTTKLNKGQKTVIDPYGGTNPAEFFAVVTETFYEKPAQLQKNYPELYDQLREYYQVDPLEWGS
ncbi:zinc-dependent peptidase [Persicirhabdus sediminis]|uniref:Zinc-dependent peptidase n=1 Tax=Persicirhabdus sediminis TaxID=454144 RepID=A0A8J7MCV3_9BACT|nr:M90 family metallopeptidase [Persicirhabdus sediminis]MBK1790177.1 zinc-dependent peptidase [Persicirhabdus sediminis]